MTLHAKFNMFHFDINAITLSLVFLDIARREGAMPPKSPTISFV